MTLPRAETLAAALVGRRVRTYLWREVEIARIEDGLVVVVGGRGEERARVALADVQAGLDQLDLVGEVPVTITALGPWASYVSAMLVEAEGVVYGDAPARLMLGGRAGAG